jgi:hypothetical protein
MKKMRYFLGFIMMTAVMFINNSCSEDIPTYTTDVYQGCNKVEETHIKVVVCDALQTYWGGAEVFVYQTEQARTDDPQRTNFWRKGTTDNSDPTNIGVIFYQTPYQTYYFFARHDLGGGNFITGVGEIKPEMCNTVKLVVVVQ